MKLRLALVAALGAAIWVGAVLLRLRSVSEQLWIARDDAVITLSHARNAAQFGSIGVSPGGDRVEGFSSPVHFLVAYLVQLVAEPGYRSLSIGILVVSAAVTGAVVAVTLRRVSLANGMSSPLAEAAAIGLTALVAAQVVASWTSVGWIGSGMENPVVILCGFGVVLAATQPRNGRTGTLVLVLSLAVFMLSRVEFAAFAVPLVVAAAWLHASRSAGAARPRIFAVTVAATLVVVALVHGVRRLYFGEWLPNTAVVQGRETGIDEFLVIAIVAALLLAWFAMALARSDLIAVERRHGMVADLRIVASVLVAGFVLVALAGRTASSIGDLLALRPFVPLAMLIGVLLVIQRVISDAPWLMNHVFAALSAVPLTQFVALGPARLDGHRVAAMAIPFMAMWGVALGIHVAGLARAPQGTAKQWQPRVRLGLGCLVLVLAFGGMAATAAADGARLLPFEVGGATEIVAVVHDVRDQNFDGGLVILANPDLGKVSFDKSAVMIDLGLLGDPLMAQIANRRPELMIPYLQFVGLPDVVEAHGFWTCQFSAWFDSPEFANRYTLSDQRWLDGVPQAEGCHLDGRRAIWVRADADAEYALTRDLLAAPEPASLVAAAIAECSAVVGDVFRCQHVRRAVQRSAAALRDDGTFDVVVEQMRLSPSARMDVPLLRRGSGWADDAFDGFVASFYGG